MKNNFFTIFFKGIFMGAADIVPGVSGGTIALIVGIYERLINAIKGINIKFVFSLFKYLTKKKTFYLKKAKEQFYKIDFALFIPLSLGIGIAFGLGSLIIPNLLEKQPAYIFAFFFGLILGSIKFVYNRIDKKGAAEYLIVGASFILSFLLVGMTGISTNHSYWFIFLSGMIAICVMLLPGISGSFMLLFLGQYEFMLNVIRNLLHSVKGGFQNISQDLTYFIIFLTGAITGLLVFSRVISHLLRKHHSKTMAFLAGLMLGSLRLPFNNIIFVKDLHPELGFVWGVWPIILIGVLFGIGVFTVSKLESYGD